MSAVPQVSSDTHYMLGRLFVQRRQAAGVSQEQMTAHLGCSINTLRWHEAGARALRADQLVLAAELLRCEPADLVQDTGGTADRPAKRSRVRTAPPPTGGSHG